MPLASLPDVPPGRVADVVVRGAGLAATVAGRPDRDAIVFVDLPPDAWEIGFRSAADGDTFAPVAWITVGADGRLESGPALERR